MDRVVQFLIALAVWLLVTWSLHPQNLVAGLLVALLCAILLGRLFPKGAGEVAPGSLARRVVWFLYYILVFLVYCLRANFDVAYRVLNVNLPIRPGIVKVKTTLQSDMGKTLLANSITLTPGTLTVDIVGQDLYIHWIYVASDDPEEQTQIIVSRFERILEKVFGK